MDKEFFDKLEKSKTQQLDKLAAKSKYITAVSVVKNLDDTVSCTYSGGTLIDAIDTIYGGIRQIVKDCPDTKLLFARRLNKILREIYAEDHNIELAIRMTENFRPQEEEEGDSQ